MAQRQASIKRKVNLLAVQMGKADHFPRHPRTAANAQAAITPGYPAARDRAEYLVEDYKWPVFRRALAEGAVQPVEVLNSLLGR